MSVFPHAHSKTTNIGKLILEAPGRLAKAPDGNGGVYLALARSGLLEEMAVAGVEALDCYCVDNALARLGDPRFIGYCHGGAGGGAGADVGARVVAKAYPEEKVRVCVCVKEHKENIAQRQCMRCSKATAYGCYLKLPRIPAAVSRRSYQPEIAQPPLL